MPGSGHCSSPWHTVRAGGRWSSAPGCAAGRSHTHRCRVGPVCANVWRCGGAVSRPSVLAAAHLAGLRRKKCLERVNDSEGENDFVTGGSDGKSSVWGCSNGTEGYRPWVSGIIPVCVAEAP